MHKYNKYKIASNLYAWVLIDFIFHILVHVHVRTVHELHSQLSLRKPKCPYLQLLMTNHD